MHVKTELTSKQIKREIFILKMEEREYTLKPGKMSVFISIAKTEEENGC
jgi:hypothetical protein